MATVTFEQASRIYPGSAIPAVDSLTMEVKDHECLVFVGPSGCGKSTSLRMVAGLEPTTSGRICIDGKDMTGVRPKARDVAMVFQSYALYPNMSVRQNMGFALENQRVPKAEIKSRVEQVAKMLELTEYLDRRPSALSGGQRQRVAMGRAIVRKPQVFCMDEPLSNLDAKLRVSMRGEIVALQRELGVTTIYVTHDQVEAMTMGHRVAVMRDGKLQQVASPKEIYTNPTNTFVAGFIGSPAISLFTCPVREGKIYLSDLALPIPTDINNKLKDRVIIGVRPESWILAEPANGMGVLTEMIEPLGAQSYLYARQVKYSGKLGDKPTLVIDNHDKDLVVNDRIPVLLPKGINPEINKHIGLIPVLEDLLFFDPDTEENLR